MTAAELLESKRKLCLQQQTELRRVMSNADQHAQAIQLFLRQHAMLHAAEMTQMALWSFEDVLFDDMSEEHARRISPRGEHSVGWCIWHIARIEDVAMNLLVAGSLQVLHGSDWLVRMKVTAHDTGNAMDVDDVASLSAAIDIAGLRAYRAAVGRRTREIVQQLQPHELKQKVDPERIQRVLDEGAVVEDAREITDYWSRRTITGLLLMPATRHSLVHLNEALQIKGRRR